MCVLVHPQMVEELHQSSHLSKLGSAFGTKSIGMQSDSQPQGIVEVCGGWSVCVCVWRGGGLCGECVGTVNMHAPTGLFVMSVSW